MARPTGDHAFTAESLHGSTPENTYSGALSFLRRRYSRDLTGVDIAVQGVPFDLATSNRPGARFGPAAIRQASAQIAWGEVWPWDFDPFDRLAVVDYGDVQFQRGQIDLMLANVESQTRQILETGSGVLTLGGDHMVTLPLLRAHAAQYGPLSLVHFDAHADRTKSDYIDHGTMFYYAVEEGLIDPARSVQIGIRTPYDRDSAFHVLEAPWVHKQSPLSVAQAISELVKDQKAYLTFDIDCLDPAYAPGTGTPVIGGLSSAKAREILQDLTSVDFVAMDIVEVAPIYDVGEVTSLAAATLAHDYLCLQASRRPSPDDE